MSDYISGKTADHNVRSVAKDFIDRLWTELEKGERIVKLSEMWTESCPPDNVFRYTQCVETKELVRCKDCKWFGNIGCAIKVVDDSDKPTENDFCSFAERKDADDAECE